MYTDYFGLKESPFSIAPDPRYLYMSPRHREALAHLLYGFKYDGGFVLLTGEVGTGKTTVCRCLLEQIPENTNVALILNPCLTAVELLASICDEFRVAHPHTDSIKVLVDCLNTFLLECNSQGRKAVLVLDEAQNLSCEVLEQIRLLTNLETNTRKLLQIVMLGQPELLDKLALPFMRQLNQRITARYHLGPLSKDESIRYVRHRLAVAGMREELCGPSVFSHLYLLSGGVPRVINVICDRAMLGAYSQNSKRISVAILERAAREVRGSIGARGRRRKESSHPWRVTAVSMLVLLAAGAGFGCWYLLAGKKSLSLLFPDTLQKGEEAVSTAATGSLPNDGAASTSTRQLLLDPLFEKVDLPLSLSPVEFNWQNALAARGAEAPSTVPSSWPATAPPGSGEGRSFAILFGRWGLAYEDADGPPCQYAGKADLRCAFAQGSLLELWSLNRPAVLELKAGDGTPFFAALLALDGQGANLVAGDKDWQASREEVERHWSGKYTLLWRPPPGYDYTIWADNKGEAVEWLKMQLAVLQEEKAPGPMQIDAGRLALMIKKFQTEQGLVPDGIAGMQTLIRLNDLLDPNTPNLQVRKERAVVPPSLVSKKAEAQ